MSRKVIKSFDDWSESVAQEIVFSRPGGDDHVFQIHAISEKARKEGSELYNKMLPPKPIAKLNSSGLPKVEDRHYKEAMQAYEQAMEDATQAIKVHYIEEGWAKPNGFSIPGETLAEKGEALSAKIAGDIDKLYLAIIKLSNLQQDDINFFLNG